MRISEFLMVDPTQTSEFPVCSNSLGPTWLMFAPETSDNITLLGYRVCRNGSIPKEFVVLTIMQVCCGVTTDSITAARS